MPGKMNWDRVCKENMILQAEINAHFIKATANRDRNSHNTKVFRYAKIVRNISKYFYLIVKCEIAADAEYVPAFIATLIIKNGKLDSIQEYYCIKEETLMPKSVLPLNAVPEYVTNRFCEILNDNGPQETYTLEEDAPPVRWLLKRDMRSLVEYYKPQTKITPTSPQIITYKAQTQGKVVCQYCGKRKFNLFDHHKAVHPTLPAPVMENNMPSPARRLPYRRA